MLFPPLSLVLNQVSDRYRSTAESASEQLRLMKEAQLLQDQLKRSRARWDVRHYARRPVVFLVFFFLRAFSAKMVAWEAAKVVYGVASQAGCWLGLLCLYAAGNEQRNSTMH